MAKTVLIAEDDKDIRVILYKMFKDRGFEVFTANDGRDALRVLREEGFPDVLMLDFNMPGYNGLEVLKEVRKRDPERKVVAILATGTHMRTADDVRTALEYADLMMAKPFDLEQLDQLILQLSKA